MHLTFVFDQPEVVHERLTAKGASMLRPPQMDGRPMNHELALRHERLFAFGAPIHGRLMQAQMHLYVRYKLAPLPELLVARVALFRVHGHVPVERFRRAKLFVALATEVDPILFVLLHQVLQLGNDVILVQQRLAIELDQKSVQFHYATAIRHQFELGQCPIGCIAVFGGARHGKKRVTTITNLVVGLLLFCFDAAIVSSFPAQLERIDLLLRHLRWMLTHHMLLSLPVQAERLLAFRARVLAGRFRLWDLTTLLLP